MQVITYRYAYLPVTTDLCADCAADHAGGTLGPVQHGAHEGECDQCGECRAAEEPEGLWACFCSECRELQAEASADCED